MKKIFFIFFVTSICFTQIVEARKRLETYLDQNGARRVVKTHKIYRDYKAVIEFKRTHPRPRDGRAYDIDHVIPLFKGGADKPSNMHWIPVEEHRQKSSEER